MIVNRIKEINPNTLKTFKEISSEIEILLSKSNIKAKVTGREKTPFSIWRKINEKRISLEKITDLIGFRIIAENIDDCYKSLGIFHQEWRAVPGRFKDYISTPKSFLGRSLICPTEAPIAYSLPKNFFRVFILDGDSTITSPLFNCFIVKIYLIIKRIMQI